MDDSNKDSVFTKIINGEVPAQKVYEDEHTLAIMDIFPIQEGMIVVFPKKQVANFEDLPEQTAIAVMKTAHKAMKALREIYPSKAKITLQIAGFQTPDHAHMTVYPATNNKEYHAEPPSIQSDHDELEKIAEKVRRSI